MSYISKIFTQKILAIVPAAGLGLRMNSQLPKQFLEINAKPILIITLETLLKTELFSSIIISTMNIELAQSLVNQYLSEYQEIIKLCKGGETRQETVFNALNFAEQNQLSEDFTLVHDAVRALIDSETILKVTQKAIETGAAIAARPLSDSLKLSKAENLIDKTIARDKLWTVQTPQVFKTTIMLEAFNKALAEGFVGTDCSSLIERLGVDVHLVESPATNIKITSPEDLELAKMILCHREESYRSAA